MKKEDIMPGGRLFPIFWMELFGTFFLIVLIMFIIGSVKRSHVKNDVSVPIETIPTMISPSNAAELNDAMEPDGKSSTKAPLPSIAPGQLTGKESLQREILDLFFDSETCYGMQYREGKLTSESFASVFYKEYGMQIGVRDVQIGDYATGNGVTGICVGYYTGLPIFAYMSEYASYGKVANGMCLGFSREQCDELFYGMYPVFFDTYYKGIEGDVTEDIFPACISMIPEPPWYAAMTYQYGKEMSDINVDYLAVCIMSERLQSNNQRLHRDKFKDFLAKLPYLQGFEGKYDLMVDSVRAKEDYTEVQVKFIPHEEPGITPVGAWAITLYKDYQKFLPCEVNFAAHTEVGFVKDKEITIHKDETGQVIIEREEIIYGQTVDEEGNRIYRLEDGTVIYLD